MAPWLVVIVELTPAFPLPPSPTGQVTSLPLQGLTLAFHSGLTLQSQVVKALVVPEPSDRWATVIAVLGRVASGLSALIAGSSQVLMAPASLLPMMTSLNFS